MLSVMLLPANANQALDTSNTVLLHDQQKQYKLGKYLEIFLDPTQRLTIQEVSQHQQKFTPSDTDIPNLGFSKSAIWAKVKLQNHSTVTSEWYLQGTFNNVDQVELYIPQENTWIKKQIGRLLPFSNRELRDRNLIFILPLAVGEEKTIYLRYTSQGTIGINAILWQPISYYENNLTQQLLLGGFYGISFTFVIINLVLIFILKNVSYQYNILFIISLTVQYFIRDDLAFQYLWPEFPEYNLSILLICLYIALVSCCTFFISFLQVRVYSHQLYKLMNWFRWTAVGYIFVYWYFPLRISIITIVFLTIIMCVLMIYASSYTLYKGFISSRFAILALGCFLLGMTIWCVTAFALLPINIFTQHFARVTTIGLLLFLAITLGDHINLLKKERNQLASGQKKLALIVENSSEFISITNLNGQAIFLNDAGKKMIGLISESSALDVNILDYLCPQERYLFESQILPTVLEIGSWEGELKFCNLTTGKIIYSIAYFLLLKDQPTAKSTTLASIVRDISPIKQAENEIIEALAKQKAISEMKSRLIAMASHEFRTPLAIISSSTGILKKFGDRLNAERKEKHLEIIQETITRMIQLLDDVLTINLAEAENMEFNPELGDIITFCRYLKEEIETTCQHHTIDFSCNLEPGVANSSLTANFDRKLLHHILTNILTNAIKYSPTETLVGFNLTKENDQLIFKITDTGIGIPEKDQVNLFAPFYRGSNVGSISGTGLGLSIVKKCVDLHKGKIIFDSHVEQGTIFTVIIPWEQ
ncbi:7TM-DISM domain-containing protein [Dolichospermum sp. LEGE 00240]|uniref:sensor histidine kinase n=1 Tax=Dolichospermum sp. LEGE 00240 TaxID=1828603 RepID=UPI0018810D5E|nr:7TM-DISM domain-containing protein [Dolichospermum sp. LEGE 00240]